MSASVHERMVSRSVVEFDEGWRERGGGGEGGKEVFGRTIRARVIIDDEFVCGWRETAWIWMVGLRLRFLVLMDIFGWGFVAVGMLSVLVRTMLRAMYAADEELAAICDLDCDIGVHGMFAEELDGELLAGFLCTNKTNN